MVQMELEKPLRLALPKGRMKAGIIRLLEEAGIQLTVDERNYRPTLSVPGFETKLLKPQNIVEMLHVGSRDIGFTGLDWVRELNADVVEVLDTELNPVRIVAAAPVSILENGQLPQRKLVVASEYERLTREWIKEKKINASFVRSYGATEVFPPEDADMIVDNSSTGSTLSANRLQIVDELLKSSTRLFVNPKTLENPERRQVVERFVLLLKSVLQARKRVMLEVNVTAERLEAVVALLPCMRRPTIASLYGDEGYAVKAAVPRAILPTLIPELKEAGGTDVVVTAPDQLVP